MATLWLFTLSKPLKTRLCVEGTEWRAGNGMQERKAG